MTKNSLLRVKNLSLRLPLHSSKELKIQEMNEQQEGKVILDSLDWEFESGKVYSLIGESGSGKTTFALSLFGIIPEQARVSYDEFTVFGSDWKSLTQKDWNQVRGKKISLIPQNPHLAFHPYRKMGDQVCEFFHHTEKNFANRDFILQTWKQFGLRNPIAAYDSYPRSLSGGEKQRISVSMAYYSPSEIIVADEPTTALDPIQEKNTMEIILKSVQEKGKTLLLVTHDLKLMSRFSDEVIVIKSGKLVEKNRKENQKFSDWKSDYANALLRAVS
ncbi:MAG: ABC transporter ATP-binding protein [Leptospira sp.]|nr:ABC transporter ATP-binding protein [Leptospira sp.]